MEQIQAWLTPEKFVQFSDQIFKFLGAIALLFAAYKGSHWLNRFVLRRSSSSALDPTLTRFLASVLRWALLVLALITVLGTLGIQTTSITAIFASLTLAIGLALQGSLTNFAAGVMLLIFRPFRIGDEIKVGLDIGKVYQIDLLTTSLDTPDNRRIIVPNHKIFGTTIENNTFFKTRRVDVNFNTSFNVDMQRLMAMLEERIKQIPGLLPNEPVKVQILSMTASNIELQIQVWGPTHLNLEIRQSCLVIIKSILDEINLEKI